MRRTPSTGDASRPGPWCTPAVTAPHEASDERPGDIGKWRGAIGFGRTLLALLPVFAAQLLVDFVALGGGLITMMFWPFLLAGYVLASLVVWFVVRNKPPRQAGRVVVAGAGVYLSCAVLFSGVALAILNDALTL